jgi:hypothetical protein
MSKRLVLSTTLLVLIALFLGAAPSFAGTWYVPFTLTYYSDSSDTVVVGVCTYRSCAQFFGSGDRTCTGATSAFFVYSDYRYCTGTIQ